MLVALPSMENPVKCEAILHPTLEVPFLSPKLLSSCCHNAEAFCFKTSSLGNTQHLFYLVILGFGKFPDLALLQLFS